MKRILLMIMLAMVATSAQATIITVNSLPVTISNSNDTIRFSGNLSLANGVAITIQTGANNVLIDGQGRTISFGTSGQNYARASASGTGRSLGPKGISAGTITGLIVRDLTLTEGAPAESCQVQTFRTTDYGTWATGLAISNVRNALFENVNVNVAGGNAQCIRTDGTGSTTAGYNVTFRNCNINSDITHFYSRSQWEEQAVVNLFNPCLRWDQPDYQFHYKFAVCSLEGNWSIIHTDGAIPSNSSLINKPLIIVDSSDFLIDHRNDNNSVTYPGWGNNNSGEAYCIALRWGDQHAANASQNWDRARITNNTFRSGTAHGGGHGIFASGTDAPGSTDSMNTVYIAHNTFNLHHGRALGASFIDGYGMKIREDPSNFWIEDNDITIVGNTEGVATSYGPNVIGIELNTPYNGGVAMTNGNSIRGMKIRNNTIRAYSLDPQSSGNTEGRCFQFSEYYTTGTYDNVIDSNTLITNGAFYVTGEFNGPGGGGNTTIRANSHAYYGGTSPNDNSTFYWYGGGSGSQSLDGTDWVFLDGTFSNSVSDIHGGLLGSITGQRDWSVRYTLSPRVLGSNGAPVRGASVTITNAYGQVVGTGTTNSDGRIEAVVTRYYEANYTADSTAFNPFSIQATKLTDVRTISHNLEWNAKAPDITLLNTLGEDSLITNVSQFPLDSNTASTSYDPLGNPRYQLMPLSDSGQFIVFAPGAGGTPNGLTGGERFLYSIWNLDSTVAANPLTGRPWVNLRIPDISTSAATSNNHAHWSVYNDTIFEVSGEFGDGNAYFRSFGFFGADPDSLYMLQKAAWGAHPGNQRFVAAILRLPGSDSILTIQRNANEPKPMNIQWKVSPNKGVTWSAPQYVVDWSTAGPAGSEEFNLRIGLAEFNNTAAAILDSNEKTVRVFLFNRATSTWEAWGNPFAWASNTWRYRCFGLGTLNDTILFAFHSTHSPGTSGPQRDTLWWTWRSVNGVAWAAPQAIDIGYRGLSGSAPYAAMTTTLADSTLWLWSNGQAAASTTDSQMLYIRRFNTQTWNWEFATRVNAPNQIFNWKVSTSQFVPASHGRQLYAQYLSKRINGATTYYMGSIARVTYGGDPEPPDEPEPPVDSFLVIRDTSVTEGGQVALIITLSPAPTATFTYQYSTSNGIAASGAIAPDDYLAISGSASIVPPSYRDTLYVTTIDDATDEINENFTMTLSALSPIGYDGVTSDKIANILIVDNDTPVAVEGRRCRYFKVTHFGIGGEPPQP